MKINLETMTVIILYILFFILLVTFKPILSKKNKKQLDKAFLVIFFLILLWIICDIAQLVFVKKFNVNPLYFDYVAYIAVCFLPLSFLFLALIFAKTNIVFKKSYCLLFIIPILSLLLLWTNDSHHLFYKQYSLNISETIYGNYIYVHYCYTYIVFAISLFILMKYSIKNSGVFSRQAIFVFTAAIIPIITNVLGFAKIISMSVYITPMSFAFTIIFLTFAMVKFNLLKIAPIALQIIVDRISDSYIVINDDCAIIDYNKTFLKTFRIKDDSIIRGRNFDEFLDELNFDTNEITKHLKKIDNNNDTERFELYIKKYNNYFSVEIAPIFVNSQSLGILILFKDITQHKNDTQKLKDNQSMLIEQERLASLGQLIGGIAHNLKTPIMSISGASEGIKDLVNEFDASIGNPIVTNDDFHDIAKDMREWLEKINSYTEYMSDILTAVKGQAVALSEQEEMDFTIDELFKKVNILMKHELKQAVIYLAMQAKIDEKTIINGDVNTLVQVVNNMISNSIQAYNGKPDQKIELIAWKNNNNNIVITVKDYGPGLPTKVKEKLFKEMITTKGKNGTGLGLYMSYSTICAHFNGDITFESEEGKGTTFNIILP